MRYFGGKWRLAPEIVALMPMHQRYVEPFGGGASVLLRKARAPLGEIYNDVDGEITNLFSVLRSPPSMQELSTAVALTPYSRDEFARAYEPSEEPVERARRTLVRSYMGFGTDAVAGAPSGFRVDLTEAQPANVWASVPERIAAVAKRFSGVVVENRDALDVILDNDDPSVLFYLDPPYLAETRSHQARCKGYRHEMSADAHAHVLDAACKLKGRVLISGYPSALYERYLKNWQRVEFASVAHGGTQRTECVWLSPNCEPPQARLF